MGYRPSKANNAAMPTHMPSETGSDYITQAKVRNTAKDNIPSQGKGGKVRERASEKTEL